MKYTFFLLEPSTKYHTNSTQVFHPFYVFQIASLLLWSMDQYYYYAIAIFLMSVGSIVTTLLETRSVSLTTFNESVDY